MQSIKALSLTSDVNAWLANSRHPRILHVFDHACNLTNERGEVLSIVTQEIGNGPFNLVVEDDVLFSEHLNTETKVFIRANEITLDGLTINIANTDIWNPRPDWERLHGKRDEILNQIMSLRASGSKRSNPHHREEIASSPRSRYGLRNERSALLDQRLLATTFPQLPLTNYQQHGLDTPFATNAQGYPSTSSGHRSTTTSLQSLISNLAPALANADIATAKTIASQLAGLGSGLTPAGDDFIMGAIYAAWIIHPHEVAKALAKEITNTAAPLTTSLSAAWLGSAGRGEAGSLWHELFDALVVGDKIEIQKTMDNILAVGETSGADAMAGFIRTVMCWAEEINREER